MSAGIDTALSLRATLRKAKAIGGGRFGLVRQKRTISRAGGTFQTTVYVRPDRKEARAIKPAKASGAPGVAAQAKSDALKTQRARKERFDKVYSEYNQALAKLRPTDKTAAAETLRAMHRGLQLAKNILEGGG